MARTALAVIVAAVLTVALATPAHAADGTWGPAIDLSGVGVSASYPQIVTAADGSIVAIWSGDDGGGRVAQIARSADAGSTWSAPLTISGTDASFLPQIALSDDGTITATWARNGIVQASSSYDNGVTWSVPIDVSAAGGSPSNPQIFADGGTTAIAWELRVGMNTVVQSSASVDSGVSWSAPVTLSVPAQVVDSNDVVVAADGTIFVTWTFDDFSGRRVQISRSTDDGATFSAPVDLSAAAGGAFNPRMAVAPNGTVIVTWQRYGVVSSVIETSRSVDGGATWSPPVTLSVDGVDSYNARIAIAPDGTIAVAWERGNGGVERIVQVATSTDSGASFGAPVDLSAVGVYSDVPAIAAAPDGTFTVAWERDIAGGSVVEVSTLVGATWSAPLQLSVSSGYVYEVQLAVAANSAVTAVWQHDDNAGSTTVQASTLTVAAAAAGLAAGGTDALPLGLAAVGLLALGGALVLRRRLA